MDPKEPLEVLRRRLSEGLSAAASANLAVDLQAILRRLAAGEYEKTDFLVRNTFDLPRRTHEFLAYFADWDRQARVWSAVLRPLPWSEIDTVTELCPGWSPKIALALTHLDYRGTLRLVDSSVTSVEQLRTFARLFRLPLELLHTQTRIEAAPEVPSALVVANHVLDDFVLDAYRAPLGLDEPSALYESEAAMRRAWDLLADVSERVLDEMPGRIADALLLHVAPEGHLAVSHYPSLAEQLFDHPRSAALFRALFERVRDAVTARGLRERVLPGDGYDPAQYFLAKRS